MKRSRIFLLIVIAAMVLGLNAAALAELVYIPVDISAVCNTRIVQASYGFPEGDRVWGGVPFNIPVGTNNAWWSGNGVDWSLSQITIPLNRFGVTEVDTLINTGWGMTGGPYTYLEFFGTHGAYYRKDLYGNVDIRGWQYDNVKFTTNSISAPTINVWDNGKQHVDKQLITLPEAFANETLLSIVMSDVGSESGGYYSQQRAYLEGLTVRAAAVPVPGAVWLLGSGLIGLAPLARRQWRRRQD